MLRQVILQQQQYCRSVVQGKNVLVKKKGP